MAVGPWLAAVPKATSALLLVLAAAAGGTAKGAARVANLVPRRGRSRRPRGIGAYRNSFFGKPDWRIVEARLRFGMSSPGWS
jgi:hypothetical protein